MPLLIKLEDVALRDKDTGDQISGLIPFICNR
jgi:hypothetical protein